VSIPKIAQRQRMEKEDFLRKGHVSFRLKDGMRPYTFGTPHGKTPRGTGMHSALIFSI
jgi:hypothetical protein